MGLNGLAGETVSLVGVRFVVDGVHLVDTSSKSVFQQAAVASGLLAQADLDDALATMPGALAAPASDEQLAAHLVATGRLNRWQAERLCHGVNKFTMGVYQLIDFIGQGGMGQIYKAEHPIMGRVVAIKVLPKHKNAPDSIASFGREVRAQAQLHHPNLVIAHDAGYDAEKDVHFLVTEYVPGTDLRRLVRKRGRLSMATAAVIISQAAEGLAHAHARGLIHRDMKPGNLLVTPEAVTKVSDLGLVGYFTEELPADANSGKIVGTADFLSPEQITQPDRLTAASDVYSLGCTLYYAVTGKVPFPGGTTRDKARAHLQIMPIDPRRLSPDLSDEFVDVLADMMSKRVEERIQTAEEVIERLSPWAYDREAAAAEINSAAPPAPTQVYPQRRQPVVGDLKDTETSLLVPPIRESGPIESPSQMSFGTSPVASASEETVPIFAEPPRYLPRHETSGITPLVQWLIIIGVATTILALGSIVVSMMLES